MRNNKTIIVTGASGFIGSHVVKFFANKKFQVIALVRHIPEASIDNVNYVIYDMKQKTEMPNFEGEAVLIHCAYSKKNIEENEIAARHILNEMKRVGIKQSVFLSSISASSKSGTNYAKQKNRLEHMFLKQAGIVIRAGLVIGKGGLFLNTLSFIKRFRLLPVIGKGDQKVFFIGIEDLIQGIQELITHSRQGVFYMCSSETFNYIDFYKSIASHFKWKLKILRFPIWLIKPIVAIYGLLPNAKINLDNLKGLHQVPELDKDVLKNSPFPFSFNSLEECLKNVQW